MKKKRKGRIFLWLGASLLMLVLIFTFTIDYIVKGGIESIGSDLTKTELTVEDVSISLLSGRGTIEGIRIRNPEEFEEEYAFEIGKVTVDLEVLSLFSDEVTVEELIVQNCTIHIEQKLPQNNLKILMDNMEVSVESDETSETAMVIEYLRIEESNVNFTSNVGGQRTANISIAKVEQENIGKNNRRTVGRVMKSILDSLALRAIKEVTGSDLKEKAKDLLKGIIK